MQHDFHKDYISYTPTFSVTWKIKKTVCIGIKKTNSTKDVKGYHFQKLPHPNDISCLFLDPNDKPIRALNKSHVVTLIPKTYFRITLNRKIDTKNL